MNICVLCPDLNSATGGVKMLYRHVDILNKNGFSAAILHQQQGFRCTWFENQTRVVYISDVSAGNVDFLVVPEAYGPGIAQFGRGINKVIFNQNAYYTFKHYSLAKDDLTTPYRHLDVVAALVVSEDNKAYLQYVFPDLPIFRVHYCVNKLLFNTNGHKRRQIAFMPRKNVGDVVQVINILKFRGALKDYDLIPIAGKNEAEVAAILRESLIYLSFGYPEGFGLPPAEAMASGCITIGYHGMGGREYLTPEFAYPITQGDIVGFARTVEAVIHEYEKDPQPLIRKTQRALSFVTDRYSAEAEEKDILDFWTATEKGSQQT